MNSNTKQPKSPGEQFIDGMYFNMRELDNVSRELTLLGMAFSDTGNATMADKLNNFSNDLDTIVLSLKNLLGQKLDHDYKVAVEGSANVLKSALAGIHVAKRG